MAPAIVMVCVGTQPAALLLPSTAELGRRIAIDGAVHDVADERMSRDHATVRWELGTWVIKDLDSRNGTQVDGERISGEVRRRGDVVLRLGSTVFVLVGSHGDEHAKLPGAGDIVGPELGAIYGQIRAYAQNPLEVGHVETLLVEGEGGTGKQLAARVWHAAGPRAGGPFVSVACGSIPEGVADRLVFGGRKGVIETFGQLQLARGGTLLLADLPALDHPAQQRLVKLCETRSEERHGIVATGRDLRAAVSDGRLRSDLYRILARRHVKLPPLRARKIDIARLVQREVGIATGNTLPAHAKLVEACCIRHWPGNVNELLDAIHQAARAAQAASSDSVRPDHLPHNAGLVAMTMSGQTQVERKTPLPKPGRDAVISALAKANGDINGCARALGVHRSELKKLLEEYGLTKE